MMKPTQLCDEPESGSFATQNNRFRNVLRTSKLGDSYSLKIFTLLKAH